jgi:tetratricopeptide (TPR) repeat protein
MQSEAYRAAIRVYESLLQDQPQDADLLNDAALAYACLDEHQRARSHLEKALDNSPSNATVFSNLIELLLKHSPMDAFFSYERRARHITDTKTKAVLRERIAHKVGVSPDGTSPHPDQHLDASLKNTRVAVVARSDAETNFQRKRRWGDYWFKQHLQVALGRYGVSLSSQDPEVVIHLFGAPAPNLHEDAFKVLWIHSHPDWISPRLLEQYDQIYCLSPSFTNRIRSWGFEAETLLGATAFSPPEQRLEDAADIVFVGNAKGTQNRPIIRDLQSTSHEAAIWGEGWDSIVPDHWIQGDYFPNDRLDQLYASAKVVLNDHHPDMRLEGFVGNRIFDVLACGGLVVSDPIHPLPPTLEDAVFTYESPSELDAILDQCLALSPEERRALNNGQEVAERYSFGKVARRILTSLPETCKRAAPSVAVRGEIRNEPPQCSEQPANTDTQPVVVMGMHRSGTSLLTRFLHRAGVFTGSTRDHLPPASDNPEGFWELRSLVELNKIILYLAGGNWSTPPSESAIESISARPRVQNVFSYFDGVPTWAIKDPRLCLTFPVLQPDLPAPPKVIRMYRDPAAIAQSLQKRNGLPEKKSRELTEVYVRRMERYTHTLDCLDVAFEDLFSERQSNVLTRLTSFLDLTAPVDHIFQVVINKSLRHH